MFKMMRPIYHLHTHTDTSLAETRQSTKLITFKQQSQLYNTQAHTHAHRHTPKKINLQSFVGFCVADFMFPLSVFTGLTCLLFIRIPISCCLGNSYFSLCPCKGKCSRGVHLQELMDDVRARLIPDYEQGASAK